MRPRLSAADLAEAPNTASSTNFSLLRHLSIMHRSRNQREYSYFALLIFHTPHSLRLSLQMLAH
jgi:hypothetical protein